VPPASPGPDPHGIVEITAAYEAWLRRQTSVVERDLAAKHDLMKESPFSFFRATYYAWAVTWAAALPEVHEAPEVAAVGDLHIENFGTWRDAEGRLAWGVNDLDEAAVLPYTNDLVRLATSASLAHESHRIEADGAELAETLLDAYEACLRGGGQEVVFAERHKRIGEAVLSRLVRPRVFWRKKVKEAKRKSRPVPAACREVLGDALPAGATDVRITPRVAGVGSLGRPRFLATATWKGGRVAREAKAIVPAATVWAGQGSRSESVETFQHLRGASIRSHDPFLQCSRGWVVRRLAPDTDKIEIKALGRKRERELAALIGAEVANVHLATADARRRILKDLARRPPNWLVKAALTMAALTAQGYDTWRKETP
jgi:hypothetical protein